MSEQMAIVPLLFAPIADSFESNWTPRSTMQVGQPTGCL
jgi:hypothetical protein